MDIEFQNVSYIYDANTPIASVGLKNINLTIKQGTYAAIIGHTGSGKSTLLQHLNALLKPTTGKVKIEDREITAQTNNKRLKEIRHRVGIVFQFAEHQLFEETVGKDIAFGPQNFGVSESDSLDLAHQMLAKVGLSDELFNISPFDLSGGQMRRVAIAGVLALQPEVLVLDEPTAGLDPQSRKDMMALFAQLHQEQGITIILVTHQMEDVANFAEQVYVLEQGQLIRTGHPEDVFFDETFIQQHQLGVPQATSFALSLRQRGLKLPSLPLTEADLVQALTTYFGKGSVKHE
ncbi:energy-coupling factor ABC transporter ATP-binding protein [Lactobacillus sp. CC-MHH1034]|uniref:energy-coupling factor ABC transporter ATP-binding protein n=1 Tax=Agrilactobacillus fermenti TaxID=2586909 RepID=UPI001E3B65C2|nr:energy-coupling factor ABC transporter ATP-binding protein [Agrilactobacillus fermenti]MCD2255353.1 energy-coupling factor ABC transporter ATP-binding protein [Agrilactobacillus fermenti]